MLSPVHIRASKFTFDNNEQMAFMKSLLQRMFYLVGIKPLLKPQLALPAEQEDKLDHDEQAELLLRQQEQPALPSLPPACLCRLTRSPQVQRGSESKRYLLDSPRILC